MMFSTCLYVYFSHPTYGEGTETTLTLQTNETSIQLNSTVNLDVTLNGLRHIVEDPECIGWAHSIEDMNMYGINDVFYLSEKSYPDELTISQYSLCLI